MDPPTQVTNPASDLSGLLARVADGDHAAFGEIYDRLAPLVFGIVRRIVRSADHSEEVTQEVFVEMWRKAADYRPSRGSVATWASVIARARATDRVRSEQATRDRQQRVAPSWVDPPVDRVEETVGVQLEQAEVRNLLSRLSGVQREVIELAFFGNRTYREVADQLALPLGTVKTRMRDALIQLREGMSP